MVKDADSAETGDPLTLSPLMIPTPDTLEARLANAGMALTWAIDADNVRYLKKAADLYGNLPAIQRTTGSQQVGWYIGVNPKDTNAVKEVLSILESRYGYGVAVGRKMKLDNETLDDVPQTTEELRERAFAPVRDAGSLTVYPTETAFYLGRRLGHSGNRDSIFAELNRVQGMRENLPTSSPAPQSPANPAQP